MIGLERQWRQRTAGLHTSTLVAIGSALFTSVPGLAGAASADTMRVAAQIISGVGFLAGGVILRDGFNVRGLITAATLWATAAVGVLTGAGFPEQAAVGAFVIVSVNLFCVPLAGIISRIPRTGGEGLQTTYTFRVRCSEAARPLVRACVLNAIRTTSLSLSTLSASAPQNGVLESVAEITTMERDDRVAERLAAALSSIEGVASVSRESTERTT